MKASKKPADADDQPSVAAEDDSSAMSRLVSACPFGPQFFLGNLRSFVRDRCPEPRESLPLVEIHLSDGTVLDLCHVITVTVRWLALAVLEDSHGRPEMQMHTELVPYELICRVTIRARAADSSRVGFDTTYEPLVDSACLGDEQAPECSLLAPGRPTGESDARS